jgi:hypothetical protein
VLEVLAVAAVIVGTPKGEGADKGWPYMGLSAGGNWRGSISVGKPRTPTEYSIEAKERSKIREQD